VGTGIRFPVHNPEVDGNVFRWILEASEDYRRIRQRERYVQLEKATAKSESVDRPKVAD
jgi:hypothetical protein